MANIKIKSSLFSCNCLTIIILITAFGLAVYYPEKASELLLNINKIFNKNSGLITERKKEIIIGIDFGSTQSGYQIFYNSLIDFQNDMIITTELIFDLYFQRGLSIGNIAHHFPKENIEKENKLYFTKFKRNLDPKVKSNMANSTIPIGGQIPNDVVILEFLRLIKEYIINNSINNLINYENIKDVTWILAVPPLWDENAKKKMKELAIKAEMSNVQIALEPEVASLAIFYDEKIKKELLKPGTSFLLVDMGGYTIDFTAMKILDENKNLEQLLKPVSFTYGSNLINEYIISIIEEAYTKVKLDKVKKTNYKLWEQTLDEIEEAKKQINDNLAGSIKININFNDGRCGSWSDKCTLKYNNIDIPYTSYNIEIPKHLVLNKIYELADEIIKSMKDQVFNSAQTINLIIITGGFSNNQILKDKINSYLKSTQKEKVFLQNPEKTVMKGAALFGIKPNQIIKRIMPVTIGISINENTFFTFVQRGKSIDTNKIIKKNIIPFDEKIQIYFADENEELNSDNKKYLDEIDIPLLENNDIPLERRNITISMKFSSYIHVKLTEIGNNNFEEKILYYPS